MFEFVIEHIQSFMLHQIHDLIDSYSFHNSK